MRLKLYAVRVYDPYCYRTGTAYVASNTRPRKPKIRELLTKEGYNIPDDFVFLSNNEPEVRHRKRYDNGHVHIVNIGLVRVNE